MKRIGRLALVCLAVLTLACDTGRREEREGAVGTAGVGAGDRNFVEKSLTAGMAEVELGTLARDRAASTDVKQFAEMMIRDHTNAANALKQEALLLASGR